MKITTSQLRQIIREEMKSYKSKAVKEAAGKKSDLTVGQEIIGGKKYYFLYNQKTGKKWGLFKSKEEAEKALNSKNLILSKPK
jgi:hypothetical protein